MDPHAVPRQITTFEFKLIGFLTLKEFAYLIVSAGFAALAYFIAPFDGAKYASASIIFGIGAFLAFFKYNERSIDVWAKNLIIKLFSSSQYYYHKHNEPPTFLRDVVYDKQVAVLHVDAQKKLVSYEQQSTINSQQPTPVKISEQVREVPQDTHLDPSTPLGMTNEGTTPENLPETPPTNSTNSTNSTISGVVKNNKDLPLPNILVYVKDRDGQVDRILKTNSQGIFATSRPFSKDAYVIEPKDTSNRFFFDTMNIDPAAGTQQLTIHSKEVL